MKPIWALFAQIWTKKNFPGKTAQLLFKHCNHLLLCKISDKTDNSLLRKMPNWWTDRLTDRLTDNCDFIVSSVGRGFNKCFPLNSQRKLKHNWKVWMIKLFQLSNKLWWQKPLQLNFRLKILSGNNLKNCFLLSFWFVRFFNENNNLFYSCFHGLNALTLLNRQILSIMIKLLVCTLLWSHLPFAKNFHHLVWVETCLKEIDLFKI